MGDQRSDTANFNRFTHRLPILTTRYTRVRDLDLSVQIDAFLV